MPDPVFESVHRLGLDLLSQQHKASDVKSIIVSPLSVTVALAMLADGADEVKRKEFCTRLGVKNTAQLASTFSFLHHTSNAPSEELDLPILSANAVFADKSFEIYAKYAAYLEGFSATVEQGIPRLADAVQKINSWIADNTRGMIKDMLDRSSLVNAHVVLINALAFKGVWEQEFDPDNTIESYPFTVSGEIAHFVPMMLQRQRKTLVSRVRGYTAVKLSYTSPEEASRISLIAYLPDEGKSMESLLDMIRKSACKDSFREEKLDTLGFPKFKSSSSTEISKVLKLLGYPIHGDFPMMGTGSAFAMQVFHDATVDIDEHGTKAAAATAIVMRRGLRQSPTNEIIFDRPFVFSISADASKLMFFTGIFVGK